MPCPHCRLTVAPGRAHVHEGDADRGTTTSGSAAGLLASEARRARDGAPEISPEEVVVALQTAAARVDVAVARLRMIDYREQADRDERLPSLASILGCCRTWKAARARAALDAAQ